MLSNRSAPPCTVIPVLVPDVQAAAEWLCNPFGFAVRLRIGNHRIQLKVRDRCLVVAEGKVAADNAYLVMVRVPDIDRHFERAREYGARILVEPKTQVFGERQHGEEDFAGASLDVYAVRG
jgi:uncharacterized glyoxalase superfamily protein PhnB